MDNHTDVNNQLSSAGVVTLSFFIPAIVTVTVPLLVIGICLCYKYTFPSRYARLKVSLTRYSQRQCSNMDTLDGVEQNTTYSNRCTLNDPEIAISEVGNFETMPTNTPTEALNQQCTEFPATTVYTNSCVDSDVEGFENPQEGDLQIPKRHSDYYFSDDDDYNQHQMGYVVMSNHSQHHTMNFALSSVIIEEENEQNCNLLTISERGCTSSREEGTSDKPSDSDEDRTEEQTKIEERYDDDNSPVSTLVSPSKFSKSKWKFTDIESPTCKPGPSFPPEYGAATSSGHETRLSDSFSASQVSFDYGCLPDQRQAYSASQLSTVGTGSQTGLFQDYMQDASQRSEHVHRKKKHGKRQEKKLPVADTKSGDSGIGPSLSVGKSLTPNRHGISLTQGPPEIRPGQYETHISMEHGMNTVAGKINRHWSSSDIRSRTVDRKQKKREAKMSSHHHTRRQHHIIHHGNRTLPRSFKEQANAKRVKENLSKTSTKCETASQTEEQSIHSQTKTKQSLEHPIVPPIKSKSHSCIPQQCEQVSMIVPECIQPTATLENCTSDGLEYRDPTNGFILSIGEGAIAEGDRLTIDIGVAMYGPFSYSEGTRRVSPVFWMCVRENASYKFIKPVKILIQHFLTIRSDEDTTAMKLSFAKASHRQNYQKENRFHKVHDIQGFKPRTRYGTILTYHFCYQCIVAKISELTVRNTNFCLIGTVPNTFVYDRTMYVFFYVTFFLDKCLETVRRQIAASDELSHCEYSETKVQFQFEEVGGPPAITIHLPQALPGGWKLGLEFKKKVKLILIHFKVIT